MSMIERRVSAIEGHAHQVGVFALTSSPRHPLSSVDPSLPLLFSRSLSLSFFSPRLLAAAMYAVLFSYPARQTQATHMMEAKKIEETRCLVRQATTLLRQHLQRSPQTPLSAEERRTLREQLQLLLPSLSIVRSYEQSHHHYRYVYATTANAVEQVLSCAALHNSDTQAERTDRDRGTAHANTTAETAPAQRNTEATPPLWKDIYGCQDAVLALRQATTLPMRYPTLFTGPRRPWRRLLLYGPPGTGKTQLAAATAAEFDAVFLSVSAADLLSKWVGESEKQVRHAFAQAAAAGPRCVLFFDEVDALCSTRGGQGESELARRLKTEFLLHLQNVAPSVLVLAATNMPWELDAAVVRRFDRFVHVGLPSTEDKLRFLHDELQGVVHAVTDEQLCRVVAQTDGHSLVDMRRLLSYAVMAPVTELLSATPTCATAATSIPSTDQPLPRQADPRLRSIPAAGDGEPGGGGEMLGETTRESVTSALTDDFTPSASDTSSLEMLPNPSNSINEDRTLTKVAFSSPESNTEVCVPPVEGRHFEAALLRVVATTSAADAARYTAWSSHVM